MCNQLIGNRGGVPFITASLVNAGSATTNAVYSLPNHTFRFLGCAGLMVVTIPTATDATVTGVSISVNNQLTPLTTNTGAALTTLAAGTYLIGFNKSTNSLRLL